MNHISVDWLSRFKRIVLLLARQYHNVIGSAWQFHGHCNIKLLCKASPRYHCWICALYLWVGRSELLPLQWSHIHLSSQQNEQVKYGGKYAQHISVIVIILKNTNEPFLCVIPQPPLGAAFRNDWPRNWGANSERSRRNPVLNASFMICSDVVGLRCLRSRTFSLSARPCCYICSSFPLDCVSRCPQWIKHETNSAWKAVITFFFFFLISHWVQFILGFP